MYTQDTIFNIQRKYPKSKLSQICRYGSFSKGLKNEFETAVVNEPSVFEPVKFYCICAKICENISKGFMVINLTQFTY